MLLFVLWERQGTPAAGLLIINICLVCLFFFFFFNNRRSTNKLKTKLTYSHGTTGVLTNYFSDILLPGWAGAEFLKWRIRLLTQKTRSLRSVIHHPRMRLGSIGDKSKTGHGVTDKTQSESKWEFCIPSTTLGKSENLSDNFKQFSHFQMNCFHMSPLWRFNTNKGKGRLESD